MAWLLAKIAALSDFVVSNESAYHINNQYATPKSSLAPAPISPMNSCEALD